MSFRKAIVSITGMLFFYLSMIAQSNTKLCKSNEKIVFSFQLNNNRYACICKEKNEKYIVYRFGTPNNIELQHPAILDSTSWQQFSFKGYSRGGGKQNAAMHYAFLNFYINNINYEVYEIWNSDDDKEKCGIFITKLLIVREI